MTVKARVAGVSTLCWHASPSTMYTHSTAAEGVQRGSRGVSEGFQRGSSGVSDSVAHQEGLDAAGAVFHPVRGALHHHAEAEHPHGVAQPRPDGVP
eukprot:1193459-Prorocentrum_minimum.AAC.1